MANSTLTVKYKSVQNMGWKNTTRSNAACIYKSFLLLRCSRFFSGLPSALNPFLPLLFFLCARSSLALSISTPPPSLPSSTCILESGQSSRVVQAKVRVTKTWWTEPVSLVSLLHFLLRYPPGPGWDACPMALAADAEHWRKNLSLLIFSVWKNTTRAWWRRKRKGREMEGRQ